MRKEEYDLKKDLKLDITTLDQHALEQALLYAKWGEKWAKAVLDRDRLKEKLTAKRAEVDEEIRSKPSLYGWDKDKSPTEVWIAHQISIHEDIEKLTQELLEAQYVVNMFAVAKDAMDHRMTSLKILTELYKGNYISTTSRTLDFHADAIEKHNAQQREALDQHPRIIKRKLRNA